MRVGYPCINRGIGCTSSSTFRLASYSEERLRATVSSNLSCLRRILDYNAGRGLLFFRISSDVVPFASHPVCRVRWQDEFGAQLRELGAFARRNGMRISMHPDQFVLLNSPDAGITERSIAELEYHCDVLEGMGLGRDAKIQIHVGGVYGDRAAAMSRFEERHRGLPARVRARLAIENDDRLYPLADCLALNERCGVPVIFDKFHHECLNHGEPVGDALDAAMGTWKRADGPMIADYSSQKAGARKGTHAEHIDAADFRRFVRAAEGRDFDVMLEIKDKERSALRALAEMKRMGVG